MVKQQISGCHLQTKQAYNGYDFSDDADIAAFGSDDENSGTSVFSEPKSSTEGCIAVPEEQAQLIYQTVEAGIPVVIYK